MRAAALHRRSVLKTTNFRPDEVSGLAFWYEADDIGEAGVVDGGVVSTWADRSTNGNDLVSQSAGTRPVYTVDGPGPSAAVHFANTGFANTAPFLQFENNLTGTSWTILMCAATLASEPGINRTLIHTDQLWVLSTTTGAPNDEWAVYPGGALYVHSGVVLQPNVYRRLGMRVRNFNDIDVITDGNIVNKTNGTAFASSWGGSRLGRRMDDQYFINARVAVLIGYNRVLTNVEYDLVDDYITSLTGV